jgi:glutathione S-transferase
MSLTAILFCFHFLSISGLTQMASTATSASRSGQKIRFVTNKMCPFAQRTWIALEEASLPYSIEEVSLYGAGGKPKWFLELNPKGQVPVLVIDDVVTVESEKTLDAVAEISGVMSQEADEREWRERIASMLLPRGKQCVLAGDTSGIKKLLEMLEPAVKGPYLCGERFSSADISAAPFMQRINSEFGIPNTCPNLQNWWATIEERPAVAKTIQSSWWWWW